MTWSAGPGLSTGPPCCPTPSPGPMRVPVISVDDHLIEPPDLFEGRLPASLAGPRTQGGRARGRVAGWIFEGNHYPNVGLNAVVGRPREEWSMEPARFDEMRPGCFDIEARIEDMDRAGIWASLCFPSLVSGFCGAVYSRAPGQGSRPRLLARLQRLAPRGVGRVPTPSASSRCSCPGWPTSRSPPPRCGPTRRAASRRSASPSSRRSWGCRPSSAGSWDPFFAACEETDTVVCLHTGASGWAPLAVARSALRDPPHLLPGQRAARRRRVAVVGRAAALPEAEHRALRGRYRLGADADGPLRLRARALGVGHARASRGPPTCCPARCCGATSGSAPSTTPRRSASAT